MNQCHTSLSFPVGETEKGTKKSVKTAFSGSHLSLEMTTSSEEHQQEEQFPAESLEQNRSESKARFRL